MLGTKSLTLAPGAVTPRRREELDTALGGLTYKALTAEAERARSKPIESLDVRDLSFRTYVDWGRKKQEKDETGAYITATDLLNRALALAPDDRLALSLSAEINLCDCVNGWSTNVAEQQAIGAAALDSGLSNFCATTSPNDCKVGGTVNTAVGGHWQQPLHCRR